MAVAVVVLDFAEVVVVVVVDGDEDERTVFMASLVGFSFGTRFWSVWSLLLIMRESLGFQNLNPNGHI